MRWQIYWQIYPPPCHLVVRNGDFTFLLLELLLADEVADLSPQMSTDPLNTTTLKLADLPPWHLVVKNGDFTFLLSELLLADEVADLPPNYWHLVVKNCNFIFLLLRVHISRSHGRFTHSVQCIMGCLLSDVIGSHYGFKKRSAIIRVVISQLAF